MEQIIKYKSADGVEFDDKGKCKSHEDLYYCVCQSMERIPKKPEETSFTNGKGYLQHEKTDVKRCMIEVLKVAQLYFNYDHMNDVLKDPFACRNGIVVRFISDCCPRFINSAWYRFICISDNYKEYGQPYYASHQDEASKTRLN